METLKIDGSIGHGGGQILRSALAASPSQNPFSKCIHSKGSRPIRSAQTASLRCFSYCKIQEQNLKVPELGLEDLLFIPRKD